MLFRSEKFCSLVKSSNTVYCVGWGISSLVVELLQMRLAVMGKKSVFIQRSSLSMWEQTRCIGKGDLVVVCELPSYSIEVTESVQAAHKNGAKVITITDSAAAPVCRTAELSLFVSANSPTFGSSIIGPLFLTHVLSSALAMTPEFEAKKHLEAQSEFLHDERIFHPIFGLKY